MARFSGICPLCEYGQCLDVGRHIYYAHICVEVAAFGQAEIRKWGDSSGTPEGIDTQEQLDNYFQKVKCSGGACGWHGYAFQMFPDSFLEQLQSVWPPGVVGYCPSCDHHHYCYPDNQGEPMPQITTPPTGLPTGLPERAFIIFTNRKAVLFGYTNQYTLNLQGDVETVGHGNSVSLKRARMCIYWSADLHGVFGLASSGPSPQCRISPPVPQFTETEGMHGFVVPSQEAVQKWEEAPWHN